jgi:hypothetical protein
LRVAGEGAYVLFIVPFIAKQALGSSSFFQWRFWFTSFIKYTRRMVGWSVVGIKYFHGSNLFPSRGLPAIYKPVISNIKALLSYYLVDVYVMWH